MLEYIKIILIKVSFDKTLFEKELKKGLNMLAREEILQLEQWCHEKFSRTYMSVLRKTFPDSPQYSL